MYLSTTPSNVRVVLKPCIPPFMSGKKCAYFSLARFALRSLVKALNIRQGDNILIPAYICDVAITPFESQGVEVRYFDIMSDFTPDFEMAESQADSKTKAMLVVHYFGFPQPLQRIKNFCQKHNLILIEDCAHTIFGKYQGQYLGTIGEAAVFSPRKFLPVTDGGILCVDPKYSLPTATYTSPILHPKQAVHLLLKQVSIQLGNNILSVAIRRRKAGNERIGGVDAWQEASGMSLLSKWILHRSPYNAIIETRRENYVYIRRLLERAPYVKLVFKELPEGVVPMAFPVLLEPYLVEKLLPYAGKYGFYLWPRLPDFRSSKYKHALYFSKRLVLLPIHQDIKSKHLEALVALLNNVCGIKKNKSAFR